jgi:hypothetical protein
MCIKHTPTYGVALPRYSRGRQMTIECVRRCPPKRRSQGDSPLLNHHLPQPFLITASAPFIISSMMPAPATASASCRPTSGPAR